MPTFTMRLSDREYQALQTGATVFNKSMADFAREALLDKVAELGTSPEMLEEFQRDLERREAAKATFEAVAVELREARDSAADARGVKAGSGARKGSAA